MKKPYLSMLLLLATMFVAGMPPISAQVSEAELKSIQTPDVVETSIGTLNFIDGAPTQETSQLVYDNLDRMRGVDAFLKGIPGASIHQLMYGPKAVGRKTSNQVLIMDRLMDSKPLFLTGNTSTLYTFGTLDLKIDGPTVVELPPGMLGVLNDAWFRYIGDLGAAGPDKGKGGNYLVLPPGYEGNVPAGYFVKKSRSYNVFLFMRGSIAKGLEPAVKNIKDHLKVYSLAKKNNPPKMEFISASEKSFNTIHSNDFTFYEHINDIIQYESMELLDPETRGLFASIGIVKGKPYAPDQRMKKILTDAVAIANATARAIVWYPRHEGAFIYPDGKSSWVMAWINKNVFFTEEGAIDSDARVMFHYPYTIVTPAMAVARAGVGSDYGIAYRDSKGLPFDGSRTYKLHIPPDAPAKDFWAVTLYDSQTRSQLQTSQAFPTLGSQAKDLKVNQDGSYDIYFAPKPPKGQEKNWLETLSGKSWFAALRLYGPLEPWINKTWRPGEIELVK